MIYLSKKDMLEMLDYKRMISSIEKAYEIQASGHFTMPDRLHIHDRENTLLYMPCLIETSYATKLVSVIPDNKNKGMPVVSGLVILNDRETGQVNAIMDGQMLTAIRTGAVGGTAVKYLAKKHSKVLGIIGCGVQGYYQCLFALQVHDFDAIVLYDAHGYHKGFNQMNVKYALSADALVDEADVIITATTSYEPVFMNPHVKDKIFIGIGSFKPDMREYSDAFIEQMDIILTDTPFAKEESGDLKIPLTKGIISASDILTFNLKGYKGTVFFKSVGMALFDNLVAEAIYELACTKKLGLELEG